MKVSVNEKIADAKYIYYVFTGVEQKEYIRMNAIQTGVPHTNLALLRDTKLHMPPLPTQTTIAHILGSLDDKIELLHQMNETLEALARALFKSWFVDFNPVRKKTDKKPTGLPPEMDRFFPDSFENSELGEIPKDWDICKLEDIIEINPSRSLANGKRAVYLEMKNLPEQGMSPIGWENKEHGGGAKFKNGDTLLARITPCLENGKTAYIQFLSGEEEVAFGSTEYIVLASRDGSLSEWCYLLARDEAFREYAILHMNGSSGRQRVEKDSISRYKVAFPRDRAVSNAFKQLVSPAFSVCKQNAEEIGTLVLLRDSFLPKLISGELELNDKMIEKILEPAK
jgi:type I restriction enzyme S subunit